MVAVKLIHKPSLCVMRMHEVGVGSIVITVIETFTFDLMNCYLGIHPIPVLPQ